MKKIQVDSQSLQQIRGFYLLYLVTNNLHESVFASSGIDDSRLYWSTSFIQSHFVCETITNVNWSDIKENRPLKPWPIDIEHQLGPVGMMREMLGFIYCQLGDEAILAFEKALTAKYSTVKNPFIPVGVEELPESIRVPQKKFECRLNSLLQNKNRLNLEDHNLLLFKLLRYIYSARENLFHGYAFITMPADEHLQQRFRVYSDLLLVTCEVLFFALERTSTWRAEDVVVESQRQYAYMKAATESSHLRNTSRSLVHWRK